MSPRCQAATICGGCKMCIRDRSNTAGTFVDPAGAPAASPAASAYNPTYDPLVSPPGRGQEYAPTYWVATAGPPPADDGPIQGDIEADVVIVGSGFTLSLIHI